VPSDALNGASTALPTSIFISSARPSGGVLLRKPLQKWGRKGFEPFTPHHVRAAHLKGITIIIIIIGVGHDSESSPSSLMLVAGLVGSNPSHSTVLFQQG
jgi:hypothetical protein